MKAHFFAGTPKTLAAIDLADIFAYRYRIFVELLGWSIPGCTQGCEMDQFDTENTIYVYARNDKGNICAHARLLPTDKPYLLADVFPELMPDPSCPPPRSEKIWELSRYSTRDLDAPVASTSSDGIDAWMCRALLAQCISYGIQHGAERLITTSPAGIAKVMRQLNVTAYKAGPLTRVDGGRHSIFAQWIDFDQKTLQSLDLQHLLLSKIAA